MVTLRPGTHSTSSTGSNIPKRNGSTSSSTYRQSSSSGDPRRPSTGSASSRTRMTEADFEAALLNPGTLFLSGSPGTTGGVGVNPGTGSGMAERMNSPPEAPKRSFEEDMRRISERDDDVVTPVKGGENGQSSGSGIGGRGMVGKIIPPTPSTIASSGGGGHARRESVATQHSIKSGDSSGTPSRYKPSGPSIGLDAELAAQEPKKVSKRRSIFRSPGTASSPDLATLVRKAKSPEPPLPTIPSSKLAKPPPTSGMMTKSSSRTSNSSSNDLTRGKSRPSEDAGSTMYASSSRMETISESRSRQASGGEDGSKTVRSKAKGIFGRIFGSHPKEHPPSPAQHTRSSSQASASYQQQQHQEEIPPVPSLPSSPPRPGRVSQDTPSDVFGQVSAASPPHRSPRSTHEDRLQPSPYSGRVSITPTGPASLSRNASLRSPADSPSSAQQEYKLSPPSTSPRPLAHPVLQSTQIDDTSPKLDTPPRANFTQDVAASLAFIGQDTPARELGHQNPPAPASQSDGSPEHKQSFDATGDASRYSSELGKKERSRRLSPGGYMSNRRTPQPSQRTTSLPSSTANSPDLYTQDTSRQRVASTPTTNTNDSESGKLPTTLHASSGNTAAVATASQSPRHSLDPVPLGSPLSARKPLLGNTGTPDFDAPQEEILVDHTVRPSSKQEVPRAPASIRLVGSPRKVEDDNNPDNAWGSSYAPDETSDITPKLPSPSQFGSADLLPTIKSPEGEEEDDEEKGRRLACEFLEDDWSSIPAEKVAIFLGGPRAVNGIALKYYMQYFDMKGQNLVESFRDLCAKLHLKAESQEIDRIIEGFSARYFECNPTTVFGTPGVVHTVTGAMLMLNTDLHIADLSKHMSRQDFVRNAMRAIQESMPTSDGASTPELVRDDSSRFGSTLSMNTPTDSVRTKTTGTVPPPAPSSHRSSSAPVIQPTSSPAIPSRMMSDVTIGSSAQGRGSSTTVSSFTYNKAWETDAENALKDIYTAVRADRILLPTSAMTMTKNRQSLISLPGSVPYDLNLKPGVRSPSDRVKALKRASMRGQPFLNNPYNPGSGFSSSDGRLSPTPSYATSINESAHLHATLGFASNLSHAVIRENEDEISSVQSTTSISTSDDMDDDELALLGAPWAKEGMLQHKLYWESTGKRAKKSEWKQYFVVISKGELFMFTFGDSKSSFAGGKVGGGNWLTNANPIGTIDLMHTLAAALPKPGYSADRPYCFSLIAPGGHTTFFQAGTEDLVHEWVATCNYWSGRRSRQPLTGGVSNMEYGWQKVLPGNAHPVSLGLHEEDRASIMSGRSGMTGMSKLGGNRSRMFSPNDRLHINDWRPPIPAGMPSPLDEEAQVDALQAYVKSLKSELEEHKAIEEPMKQQYTPSSKNALKSRENWKTKLQYLHSEIVKYDTYVDSLKAAIALRVKKQGERRLEKSLARSVTSFHRHGSQDLSAVSTGLGLGISGVASEKDDRTIGSSGRRKS